MTGRTWKNKYHFLCFDCRRGWKSGFWDSKCTCGKAGDRITFVYKIPKNNNIKEWEYRKTILKEGVTEYWCDYISSLKYPKIQQTLIIPRKYTGWKDKKVKERKHKEL